MSKLDVNALAQQMISAVRGFVARSESALMEKINALSVRLDGLPMPRDGHDGKDGRDGKDATDEQVSAIVDPLLRTHAGRILLLLDERISALPKPKDGEAGVRGEQGAQGERGEAGPRGEAGTQGERGEAGPRGEQGAPGEPGAPGRDGKDVTDEQVRAILLPIVNAESNQILGVLSEKVDALPKPKDGAVGPRGEAGPQGERGEIGPQGEVGPRGKDGVNGEAGARGEVGAQGRDGKDGRDGRDGKDGAAGRDAAELNILPGIDEAKSYAAGTWARRAGGLLRAARQTDALTKEGESLLNAGWEVMVEGLAATIVTQLADPREFEVAAVLTSGTKLITSFRIPMIIYQQVWREGEYRQGDVVTWNGSVWHCQIERTTEKPGIQGGTDWKLMVKRGADGKDAGEGGPAARSPVVRVK